MDNKSPIVTTLETIFYKEKKDCANNSLHPIIFRNVKEGPKSLFRDPPLNALEKDVPNTYFVYDNLDLLHKFYSLQSNKDKELITQWIKSYLESYNGYTCGPRGGNTYVVTLYLAFYFLYRIDRLDIALDSIKKRSQSELNSKAIILAVHHILRTEYINLNRARLELIKKIMHNIFHPKGVIIKLRSKIDFSPFDNFIGPDEEIFNDLVNEIELLWLRNDLSEFTEKEIKEDKHAIEKEMVAFGFSKDSIDALEKIDQEYFLTEDEFNYRNNINLLKDVFDRVVDKIIKNLESKGNVVPAKTGNQTPTEVRQNFVADKLGFTKEETVFLKSLNNLLSSEKHSLKSKKEMYRLTKNITIEFIFFLFKKMENSS